ncbi:MAG TPA: ribosome-associated translation inhibitor RaiA [Polyangiaceae bacterium]|nr:ribosome-associated translation inhibitor RaiA [Polyangiaceae bacterium]
MNVSITFRHLDPSDSIKAYATEKLGRVQKFLRQPMSARVTISLDKLEHCVEVQVQSGGQWYEAKETSADTYASIDAVVDKIERQITHAKGVMSSRRRKDTDLRHSSPESEAVALAAGDR